MGKRNKLAEGYVCGLLLTSDVVFQADYASDMPFHRFFRAWIGLARQRPHHGHAARRCSGNEMDLANYWQWVADFGFFIHGLNIPAGMYRRKTWRAMKKQGKSTL